MRHSRDDNDDYHEEEEEDGNSAANEKGERGCEVAFEASSMRGRLCLRPHDEDDDADSTVGSFPRITNDCVCNQHHSKQR